MFARKIIYKIYRLLTTILYRVPRRLTRAGLAMLGAIAAAGALSSDVSQSHAYQAFLVLVCLGAASLVTLCFFRAKFTARRNLPRFGAVGLPVCYSVTLCNRSHKPQKGLFLLETLQDPRPGFQEFAAIQIDDEKHTRSFSVTKRAKRRSFKQAETKETAIPTLPPGVETDVPMELTPLKRGILHFKEVIVARPDPLGLIKAFSRTPLPDTILVLPKRYPLPPIPLPGTMKYQQGGVAMASSVGESEEFVSLRDYRQGDPLRHIHWRSWARIGKPIVKEFQDEFFVRHALILDTFTSHTYSDTFEEAVSVAASFACAVQSQESLLDLLFVGTEAYCFTSGRALAHTEQMLEILASVRACNDKPFTTLENLVLHHTGTVSGCICVLLAWDNDRKDLVEKLQMLGLPILVLVVIDKETPVPEPGPKLINPENFHVLKVGSVAEQLATL